MPEAVAETLERLSRECNATAHELQVLSQKTEASGRKAVLLDISARLDSLQEELAKEARSCSQPNSRSAIADAVDQVFTFAREQVEGHDENRALWRCIERLDELQREYAQAEQLDAEPATRQLLARHRHEIAAAANRLRDVAAQSS